MLADVSGIKSINIYHTTWYHIPENSYHYRDRLETHVHYKIILSVTIICTNFPFKLVVIVFNEVPSPPERND
jgi:hypothetical protein